MKYLILLLFIVISLSVEGQLTYDEYGEIIPFSLSEKYSDIINSNQLPSITLPSFNNDSLYFEKNGKGPRSNVYAAGIFIDTIVDIRKHAKKIILEEGTLWVLLVKSKTAESLDLYIEGFQMPVGSYLCYLPIDDPEYRRIFTEPSTNDFYGICPGTKILIEYFEPKDKISNCQILLHKVAYYYVNATNSSPASKPGYYGTTVYLLKKPAIYHSTRFFIDVLDNKTQLEEVYINNS